MVARSFIDALLEHGEVANYYLAHSARAGYVSQAWQNR